MTVSRLPALVRRLHQAVARSPPSWLGMSPSSSELPFSSSRSQRRRLNTSGICMSRPSSSMHPPRLQPPNNFRRVHSRSCTSMKPMVISPQSSHTPESSLPFSMSKPALLPTQNLDVLQRMRKLGIFSLTCVMSPTRFPMPTCML